MSADETSTLSTTGGGVEWIRQFISRFGGDQPSAFRWGQFAAALITALFGAIFEGIIAIPLAFQEAIAVVMRGMTNFLSSLIGAILGTDTQLRQAFDSAVAEIGSFPPALQFLIAVGIVLATLYLLQKGVGLFGE